MYLSYAPFGQNATNLKQPFYYAEFEKTTTKNNGSMYYDRNTTVTSVFQTNLTIFTINNWTLVQNNFVPGRIM